VISSDRSSRSCRTSSISVRIRDAGGPTVAHWEIPIGGHVGGLAAVPAAHERRVVGVFDRALLGR
jgi:hypothetical protein